MPFYRLLGNQDASMIQGRTRFVNLLNEAFYSYARNHENFYIHDINYESASHTGTKIKYSAIGFKLRMQSIRLLIRDVLSEYGGLLNSLNNHYKFHQQMNSLFFHYQRIK